MKSLLPRLAPVTLAALTIGACAKSSPTKPPQAPVQTEVPPAASTTEDVQPTPSDVELSPTETSGRFLAPLPSAVTSFGSATSDSEFFVVGGYSGPPHAYSKEGQSNEVLALAVKGGSRWQKIATMSEALQGLVAIHHQGRLCHFGGNHASNARGEPTKMKSVSAARCLHRTSGAWIDLPPLPEGRSSHGGTIIDGKVYLAGGWTLAGNASTGKFATSLLVLDLNDPQAKWQSFPAPFARRAVGVAAVGRVLAVVGGMTADGRPSSAVDLYDTETGQWTSGPAHPGDAFGIAVAASQDAIYASGKEGYLRSLRPGEKEWKTVRALAFARFFHEMKVVSGEAVVVGGIGGMHTRGRTRVVEKLSLSPGTAYGQMDFTITSRVKNRQGLMLCGEELYLFGGNLSLEQHDFERQHFTNDGWRLDLATLRLASSATFPHRRQSMQTINTIDGGLAIGGFGHEPLPGADTQALSHDDVLSFSWATGSWTSAGKLPRGRTQFGLTEGAGKLWIFGGLNYDPGRKNAFEHDLSIWVSDDEKIAFQVAEIALPGPRRAFAGAALDGKYYLVGGMKDGFQLVDDCLEFDFESQAFSSIPCPAPRLSGDLIPAGGRLYLVGGSVKTEDGIEESRSVEAYDPVAKAWTKLDFEIPFSTRHMRALPYREQILMLTTHFASQQMTVGLLSP